MNNRMARNRMDGCREFDARLMDAAAEPVDLDESLRSHVDACPRCAAALDDYRWTSNAIHEAFARGPSQPRARLLRLPALAALAAVFLLALTAGWLMHSGLTGKTVPGSPARDLATEGLSVRPEQDAVVHLFGDQHARIESGTSTFVIRDSSSLVETPLGPLNCDACEFTVSVDPCAGAASLNG